MRPALRRLGVLVVASSAYFFLTSGGVFDSHPVADFAAGYGPPYFAMLWVSDDARLTRYWPAYHYGLFIFVLWFVAVPHYVLKTRDRRAVLLAFGWLLFLSLPALSSGVGWCFYEDLPDFRD